MLLIFSCLFYCFLGSLAGFLTHIFEGLFRTSIIFDLDYIKATAYNFWTVLCTMSLVSLFISLFALSMPIVFLEFIGIKEIDSLYDILYYLLSFAAFDFGLKNKIHK